MKNVNQVFEEMVKKGYKERSEQKRMALNIEWGIENKKSMIFEAPTGTGKSLAYLIPAILSKKKVMIITNNKNLQDQIYNKDAPAALNLCGIHRKFTTLKGRSNYFCETALFKTAGLIEDSVKQQMVEWAKNYNGDLSLFPYEPRLIPHVCCSEYVDHEDGKICYHQAAKKKADEADIVITNHTLFVIDGYLRDATDGFARLLPDTDMVVIDEAHEFPENAKRALEDSITIQGMKSFVTKIKAPTGIVDAFTHIISLYSGTISCIPELSDLIERIKSVQVQGDESSKRKENMINRLTQFVSENDREGRWVEERDKKKSLNRRMLFIGDILEKYYGERTIFATSATLAVGGSFDYIETQMGLSKAKVGIFKSPFNYRKNCGIYISPELTEDEKITNLEHLLQMSAGQAFVLFTSVKDMKYVRERLSSEHPVIMQGENGKTVQQCLQEFKDTPNAILLALKSFWQGVDIQRDKLSMVVIWKLPFEYWMDPIVQILNKKNKNFFKEKYLPDCSIALKQGVGRLIRTETDRGVIAIMDHRIEGGYGGILMKDLPNGRLLQTERDVKDFFTQKITPILSKEEFMEKAADKGIKPGAGMWNNYMNKKWERTCDELGVAVEDTC